MTRLKKILATGLMILVSCCTYLGSAIVNVAQSLFSFKSASAASFNPGNTNDSASTKNGDILSIPALPTDGMVGKNILLPLDTVKTYSDAEQNSETTTNKLFVEIIDPLGQSLTSYNENGSSKQDYTVSNDASQVTVGSSITLNPKMSGIYTVIYHTLNASEVWSSSYENKIAVTSLKYNMKFITNGSIVMPNTVKIYDATSENAYLNNVNIGLPLLYDENGSLIENTDILLKIDGQEQDYVIKYENLADKKLNEVSKLTGSDATVNTYTEYKTYTIRLATDEDASLKYSLNININGTINLPANVSNSAVVYDLNAISFVAVKGNNKISYTFNENNNYVSSIGYTVEGDSEYEIDDIELLATPTSTLKDSSVSYYTKKYLSSVSAVDKNNDNTAVNAFYYYVIYEVDNNGNKTTSNVEIGRDENGYYFIPKANGKYEIYYNVLDFYGNTVKGDNKEQNDYEVTVTDRIAPDFVYTNSYDYTNSDLTSDDLEDISYKIANKVQLSTDDENHTKLVIPAVWAKDQGENTVSTLTRYIKSNSKTFLNNNGESVEGYLYINDNSGSTRVSGFDLPEGVDLESIISFDGISLDEETGDYVFPEGVTGNELRNLKSSKLVTIDLDPALFQPGTYTLTLEVSDGSNSNTLNKTYTFEIVGADETFEETRPTVKFGTLTVGDVIENQKVSIAVPTATDSVDTRLLVKYYVVVDGSYVEVNTDEDGKNIVFNTSDELTTGTSIYKAASTSGKDIEVVAIAYNDYANYDLDVNEIINNYDKQDEKFKGIAKGSVLISLKSKTTDTIAPKFISFGTQNESVIQNQSYTLQDFTFKDDTRNAKVYIEITDTKGNQYAYQGGKKTIEEVSDGEYLYKYTISGVSFIPTNADADNYYTVKYTIVDGGNNVVSYSFVLVAPQDKTPPVITGFDGSSSEIELGQTVTINGLTVTDNRTGSKQVTFVVTTKLDGNELLNGAEVKQEDNSIRFTPDQIGTYTLEIVAIDEANNQSEPRTISIVVKDSYKPVIEVNGSTVIPAVSEDKIIKNDDTGEEDYSNIIIELPTFTVADYIDSDSSEMNTMTKTTGKITISTPEAEDSKITATVYEYNLDGSFVGEDKDNYLNFRLEDGVFKFTPFARGVYTITYSGSDGTNSADEIEFTVDVGQITKPTIYLSSGFNSLLSKGFVLDDNSTLKVNTRAYLSKVGVDLSGIDDLCLTVQDDYGFNNVNTDEDNNDAEYIIATVRLVGPNGSSVTKSDESDGDIALYDLTQTGTYKLEFTIKNKLNVERTYSTTFEVKAKEVNTVDTTKILGTVLIIVSAVILVGVIIYFVKGTKMLPKKKEKNKNKSKSEE